MNATFRLTLVCGLMTLAACAPIKITQPDDVRKTQAIPQIELKFDGDYRPGTFGATLDGIDVTNSVFQSCVAATAGNVCSVQAPAFGLAESTLRVSGDFVGNVLFSTCCSTRTIRPAEIRFSLDAQGACLNPPGPSVGGSSSGGSSSGSSGSSGGSSVTIGGAYDTCVPSFRLIVNETQSKSVWVLLPVAPSNPAGQVITITPASNAVALNNAAAGAAINITVPANDRRAAFSVRAINASNGNFDLRAEAPGYATALGSICTRNSTSRC
jgi:hypothetical protein